MYKSIVRRAATSRKLLSFSSRCLSCSSSGPNNESHSLQHHRKGKLYHWNDILFASSFNEIMKLDPSTLDLSQYSVSLLSSLPSNLIDLIIVFILFQIFREKNFIKSFDKGFFSLLPFVVRAYERLVELIDHEMQSSNCQKIIMPTIVGKHLWVKSERWDNSGEEIFKLQDRHKNVFCLAPVSTLTSLFIHVVICLEIFPLSSFSLFLISLTLTMTISQCLSLPSFSSIWQSIAFYSSPTRHKKRLSPR